MWGIIDGYGDNANCFHSLFLFIVEVQSEKGITNYRIYKALNLNPGNVNAFLKCGDVSKVGVNTARKILGFVNQYVANPAV